jgi:hypothetical protein
MLHVLNIVWSVFNTVLRGVLIKTFWAWFLVSQFPQLPLISVVPAIGFSCMIAALTPYKSITAAEWEMYKESAKGDSLSMGLLNNGIQTVGTALLLLSGWITHHFM